MCNIIGCLIPKPCSVLTFLKEYMSQSMRISTPKSISRDPKKKLGR